MRLLFGAALGFVIGAITQELVHETGRCSRRSVKCPCEERGAKRQFNTDWNPEAPLNERIDSVVRRRNPSLNKRLN